MKKHVSKPDVSLFPFLSVLLCTMGILAFMSITFLLVSHQDIEDPTPKTIDFQWVGAPNFVNPVFIRCYKDQIEYFDVFKNEDRSISLVQLLEEIQGQNRPFIRYLRQLVMLNTQIKRSFGTKEYYPLLLVYPDGILASELLMLIIERIEGLNVGLEPMLPNWNIPYQSH